MSSTAPPVRRQRDIKALVLLFFKGMAMGAADSVPGVSGGTIAFITNIYEELLDSLRRFNFLALRILIRGGIRELWQHVNATFLCTLLAGIVLSLLLLANLVVYLLEAWREPLMGFFSGLVLASAVYLGGQITRWSAGQLLMLALGLLCTVLLAFLPQTGGSSSLLYFFFCGALAICAMILPGISGAFILLLLGAYEPVMAALRNLQGDIIAVFIIGCVTGLLSFANLLSWLFRHHRQPTLALLLGVLLGSLYSIWPWQLPTAWRTDSSGLEEAVLFRPVSPGGYESVAGVPAHVGVTLAAALIGFLMVLSLEHIFVRWRRQ